MKPTRSGRQPKQKSPASDLFSIPGFWQNCATGSVWSLSRRSVNISCGNQDYEKIVWPKIVKV